MDPVPHVSLRNLRHALDNDCTDSDCEIHHPEVGFREETVNATDLAFFYAGATQLARILASVGISSRRTRPALAQLRITHIPDEANR